MLIGITGGVLRLASVIGVLVVGAALWNSVARAEPPEWQLAMAAPPGGRFSAIAVDPGNPARVYVADEAARRPGVNIYASENQGHTWTLVKAATVPMVIEGRERQVAAPDAIRFVTSLAVGIDGAVYLTGESVKKSDDGGQTWRSILPVFGKKVVADPSQPSLIYVVQGGGSLGYVHRSSDGGETWERSALPIPCDPGQLGIAIDRPGTLYVGGGCGLLRSTDAGTSWEQLSSVPSTVLTIATNPARPGQVLVGTTPNPGGLWHSDDYGDTWQQPPQAPRRVDWVAACPEDSDGSRTLVFGRPPVPAGLFIGSHADDAWKPLELPQGSDSFSDVLDIAADQLILGSASGLWWRDLPSECHGQGRS